MNLFNRHEGGLMDDIRCDEQAYLIWKWRPAGAGANTTNKENAIRFGSRLRVKDGELAVFVYPQKDGNLQDYIKGPHDEVLHTANFPALSSILGAAFGGGSPFQAEVYFINLAGNVQIKFGIPFFDIFDQRFPDLGIPCAVRGTLTFNLTDYASFIKLNRLVNFDLDDFNTEVRDDFIRKAKEVVISIPGKEGIPVVQVESRIDEMSDMVQAKLKDSFAQDFGINLKRVDISAVELDKTSDNYKQLKGNSADQQSKFIDAQTNINITNLGETMRIQRKETELQVEGRNFAAHQLDQQTVVLKDAAQGLGNMGNVNLGGGFSAGGYMAGMMVGGAVGRQMGDMLNVAPPPPPAPTANYFIAINGQQAGPYNIQQLQQLAAAGQFTAVHYVWAQGMANWELAGTNLAVAPVFAAVPPPPPPAK